MIDSIQYSVNEIQNFYFKFYFALKSCYITHTLHLYIELLIGKCLKIKNRKLYISRQSGAVKNCKLSTTLKISSCRKIVINIEENNVTPR